MDDVVKLNVQLEQIEDMPEFEPVEAHQPGVEKQRLDEKTQSIVDAFSVIDQQNRWFAKTIVVLNRNIVKVLAVAQSAVRDAAEAEKLAKKANERLDDLGNKPYKIFWKGAEKIFWLAIGGGLLALAEKYLLGK